MSHLFRLSGGGLGLLASALFCAPADAAVPAWPRGGQAPAMPADRCEAIWAQLRPALAVHARPDNEDFMTWASEDRRELEAGRFGDYIDSVYGAMGTERPAAQAGGQLTPDLYAAVFRPALVASVEFRERELVEYRAVMHQEPSRFDLVRQQWALCWFDARFAAGWGGSPIAPGQLAATQAPKVPPEMALNMRGAFGSGCVRAEFGRVRQEEGSWWAVYRLRNTCPRDQVAMVELRTRYGLETFWPGPWNIGRWPVPREGVAPPGLGFKPMYFADGGLRYHIPANGVLESDTRVVLDQGPFDAWTASCDAYGQGNVRQVLYRSRPTLREGGMFACKPS